MDTKISKLKQNLDSIISFLTPLLPLANAHMVEFFTESHWDKLLPYNLKCYLEDRDLNDAINEFWDAGYNKNETEITNWVQLARSHCLTVDNDFCLSAQGLEELIKSRGGCMHYQIKVTEFMTSKKSYEVQTMSPYVASWHGMAGTTHCVEAGGGKGNLLVALSLGYQIPSLTVDCDERTLRNGEKRLRIIQKQWHAIAKKINETSEEKVTKNINYDLHKFATAYITKNTDLSEVVCKQFDCDNANLLLTGLHTCGNLGPDSLRIFTSCPAVGALFNVPCCYHLLTEAVDGGLFDGFEREHSGVVDCGFPMSEHLRGFNLGSNARMLAGQSIDRVIAYRQLPIRSLLYRAKLQKIIKNQTPPLSIPERKLKGLSGESFEEYFKAADAILKTGLDSCHVDIPDLENMNCQWKKIVLFYLVRLCLAQVVESVILMDRLLFLYENGFSNVFLVKLFDPVLSPRCHSIVAIR